MPQTPRHLRFRPACLHEQGGAQRHCTKPLREERYVCKTRGDSGARRPAARDARLGRPEGPRAQADVTPPLGLRRLQSGPASPPHSCFCSPFCV